MKRKIRKNCDTLASLGIGVYLLGIWSVVKSTIYYTLNFTDITAMLRDKNDSPFFYYCFVLVIMIIILAAHLYIGASARAEGTRGERHTAYIIFAVLLAFLYIRSLPGDLDINDMPDQTIIDAIASMITDATTAIILLHTAYTSIKIKLLMRQSREQEAA